MPVDHRPAPKRLVQPGDAFAVPLGDGRFGAVRVLRTVDDKGERTALVAVTPWIGSRVPDAIDPALRQILLEHRGFFRGRPAICWYDGQPPVEFIHLGVIPPTGEELQIDPQGGYCGQWDVSMVRSVVLELESRDPGAPRASAERTPMRQDVDRVTGVVAEDEFWHVIGVLDWSADDDEEILEPAVEYLAAQSPDKIAGFQRMLCDKLFQLDREEFARQIGDYAYGSSAGFSADHFLDVRSAVVANGRQFYDAVLADPRKMPKDREFEALLMLAETAYRRKTGRTPVFLGAKECQTFSNRAGWRTTNG